MTIVLCEEREEALKTILKILSSFIALGCGTSEAADLRGLYGQLEFGFAAGDQNTSVSTQGHSLPLYSFPVDGTVGGAELGYRWRLRDGTTLDWYVGVSAAARWGEVSGGRSWQYQSTHIQVSFSGQTLYTISGQVGVSYRRLYAYADIGYAALDSNLCVFGKGSFREHSGSGHVCADGFAVGPYYALGVSYELRDKTWIGLEWQQYKYSAFDHWSVAAKSVEAEAALDYGVMAFTFTRQFGRNGERVSPSGYTPGRAQAARNAIRSGS